MKHAPNLCLAVCLGLVACGTDDQATNQAAPSDPTPKPPRIDASEKVEQAALERLDVLKEITAVLATVSEPGSALAQEASLEPLFSKYNELGQVAVGEGHKLLELAKLTAQLAPDASRAIRDEFNQQMLRVRQFGPAQKAMIDRLRKAGLPPSPADNATEAELKKHLEKLGVPPTPPGSGGAPQPPPSE